MKNKKSQKQLDDIYNFMSDAYNGNWKFRWGSTPYFDTAKTGKTESIIGHEWSCCIFWVILRRACPALNSIVDSTKIFEMLLSHDLGETHLGDVSRFLQLQGHGKDKQITEGESIKFMIKELDNKTKNEINNLFEGFERKPDEMNDLESLVTKFLDSLQGNHFALIFGHNLHEYSEPISKIVNKHFFTYAQKLLDVLESSGYTEAKKEIKEILDHHVDLIKSKGINLDITNLPH